jgi:Putative transposase
VVDGVFEEVQSGAAGDDKATSANVIFHLSSGIDDTAMAQAQATLCRRILRAFVGRGLLESVDAQEMLGYQHSGFSVDAGVCIQAHERAALERLLRYCARPPFAMERLRKEGKDLMYRCAKQHNEPSSDKRGARIDELHLTPLELIERIAALVPPPRTHRHRYFCVLAPNSPLRAGVTALAAPMPLCTAQAQTATTAKGSTGADLSGLVPADKTTPSAPEPVQPKRTPVHYLWAVLIARIYEVFPLLCPICGGHMRIIAFITQSADIRRILDHIGVESEPPKISPARGPPLWDECGDAQQGEGTQVEPDWDLAAQPAPDYEMDQRINW